MTNKQQWQLKGLCLLARKRGAVAATPDQLMRATVHVMRTSPVKQITCHNALWLADKVVARGCHRSMNLDTAEGNRMELRRQIGKWVI